MKLRTTPGRSGWRRAARGTFALAAATTLVASLGVPAQADYMDGGMPRLNFNYRTPDVNGTWQGFFDTANIRWNQRVGSSIGRSTSAASYATAGYFGQDWYGWYQPYGERYLNRTFTVRVNVETLSGDAGSNFSLWCMSTTTHEFGHALSLADDPHTGQATIMSHARNRTTSQLPTSYDISEVKRFYG